MTDLILSLSAVLAVAAVSSIGIAVLPWSDSEVKASALAWSALGTAAAKLFRAGATGMARFPEAVAAAAAPPAGARTAGALTR